MVIFPEWFCNKSVFYPRLWKLLFHLHVLIPIWWNLRFYFGSTFAVDGACVSYLARGLEEEWETTLAFRPHTYRLQVYYVDGIIWDPREKRRVCKGQLLCRWEFSDCLYLWHAGLDVIPKWKNSTGNNINYSRSGDFGHGEDLADGSDLASNSGGQECCRVSIPTLF